MTLQVIGVGAIANDGTGDPIRTAFQKVNANFAGLSNYADITSFGAQPGVDCTTIMSTAALAVSNLIFPAGAWVITSLPTIPAGVQITALPGASFTGVGAGLLGLDNQSTTVGNQISDYNPSIAGVLATLNVFRNPHYTGGPAGVNAAIRAQTNVGANVTNKEWAIIGIVNNSAAVGVGAQVGVYGQGNKGSPGVRAGPTWGMVAEGHDKSGLADPTDGCVGHEVDIYGTGTDVNGRRIGIDIVVGTDSGAACQATYGLRIGPQNGNSANGTFVNGIFMLGSFAQAIDVSTAVISGPAIRLANLQKISFSANDSKQLSYIGGATGLAYQVSASTVINLVDTGAIQLAPGTALPAGGSTSVFLSLYSAFGLGIYAGSGAPTISAAKGSIYIRSDGSGIANRFYIATDSVGTWTNVVTAA